MISALLWLGGRALKVLGSIPVWAYAAAALFAWGAYGHHKATNAKLEAVQQEARAEAKLREQQENNRNDEWTRNESNRLIAASLAKAREHSRAVERDAAGRMRALAAAWAASAASAGSASCTAADGTPAVAVLRDDVRDVLISNAAVADGLRDQVKGLQDYVTNVCRPASAP